MKPVILYEDEMLLALNKPAGIPVIPNHPDDKRTMTGLASLYLEEKGENAKAHPCHRLDKDTTGVLLFAKGKKNQQTFMDLFHQNRVRKFYLALVNGKMRQDEGKIDYLVEGKPALTLYRVLKKTEAYSVCDIELMTGRTNQIRIHFKMIGHPVLGDYKFGIRKDFTVSMKRTALHCRKMSFTHPATGNSLDLEAPLPDDMKKMAEI
jgi:RluA family pseudouridine synthase